MSTDACTLHCWKVELAAAENFFSCFSSHFFGVKLLYDYGFSDALANIHVIQAKITWRTWNAGWPTLPHILALSPGPAGRILDTGRSALPPTGRHLVATLAAHTTLKQKFKNLKPRPRIMAPSPGIGGRILDTGRSVLPPTGSHLVANLSAHTTSTEQNFKIWKRGLRHGWGWSDSIVSDPS